MNYKKHKARWSACMECALHECRRSVVLLRAKRIPCPVLFIGEAPGVSEDVLGKPFVGPAGKLLDQIIDAADIGLRDHALTNLIACIPVEEGDKVSVPPKYAVQACKSRLNECIDLVAPQLIVSVGSEAKKWLPKIVLDWEDYATTDLLHPAAILRMKPAQQGLAVQKQVVVLAGAWRKVS